MPVELRLAPVVCGRSQAWTRWRAMTVWVGLGGSLRRPEPTRSFSQPEQQIRQTV